MWAAGGEPPRGDSLPARVDSGGKLARVSRGDRNALAAGQARGDGFFGRPRRRPDIWFEDLKETWPGRCIGRRQGDRDRGVPVGGDGAMDDECAGFSDPRYRAVKKLGSGGQAVVYRAVDTVTGGIVAVKVISADADDPQFLEDMLQKEARLQETLSNADARHRNIVAIIEIRSVTVTESATGDRPPITKTTPAIVMELVEGSALNRLMRDAARDVPGGCLAQARCFDIVYQVCEALSFAHDRNVMHRDIKPNNIMVCRDGVVKVIDWGVAKTLDIAAESAYTYAGTPPYMSPEVVRLQDLSRVERQAGKGVDHRTDIYSLGVTMFEMVTTTKPYGKDRDKILAGVTLAQQTALRERGVSRALADIILTAMAADPRERFQSVAELVEALRGVVGQPELADPPPPDPVVTEPPPQLLARLQATKARYAADPKRLGQETEQSYLALIREYPTEAVARVELASFVYDRGEHSRAIGILDEAIGRLGDRADLYFQRGQMHEAGHDDRLALRDYRRALELGISGRDRKVLQLKIGRLSKPAR